MQQHRKASEAAFQDEHWDVFCSSHHVANLASCMRRQLAVLHAGKLYSMEAWLSCAVQCYTVFLSAGFVALVPRGRVGLARMGPKLLVSDRSTADQPFLRWQLQVRGRNACVEFGVVPETHLVTAWCLFCTACTWSVMAL